MARRIDHTLLRPEATDAQVRALCDEAIAHEFANVCVNQDRLALAVHVLAGSGPGACTVIDFPLGASGLDLKREAARRAIELGAAELDMVIAIGRLRDGDDGHVTEQIAAVVQEAGRRPVKVILETALLRPEEIDRAVGLACRGGAAFVKTSTGFGPGGASVEAVRRMRAAAGTALRVKASGGIRDAEAALAMLQAGADRLGTSASIAILAGWRALSAH